MKIVFLGDSITDMGRDRTADLTAFSYGASYVYLITAKLAKENPGKFEIYNRGVSGDRIVDAYARIKKDVWNIKPDVLSIFIGINDVLHEVLDRNGVDIIRYENVYRTLIKETLERLPNVKIVLMAPYVYDGSLTEENREKFNAVADYAKVVEKLAGEFGLMFIPLQKKLDEYVNKYGADKFSYDGVHPDLAGSMVIAEAWLEKTKDVLND